MNDTSKSTATKSDDSSPLTEKEISEGSKRVDALLQELSKDEAMRELLTDALPEP
jgi:hypothetical protein